MLLHSLEPGAKEPAYHPAVSYEILRTDTCGWIWETERCVLLNVLLIERSIWFDCSWSIGLWNVKLLYQMHCKFPTKTCTKCTDFYEHSIKFWSTANETLCVLFNVHMWTACLVSRYVCDNCHFVSNTDIPGLFIPLQIVFHLFALRADAERWMLFTPAHILGH
jgi:hypothetical protein